MNYILIWAILDYAERGGGTFFDIFSSLAEMEKKMDELRVEYNDLLDIKLRAALREVYDVEMIPINNEQ